MFDIKVCPSCGSKTIKRIRRNWVGVYQGRSYTVPALEFHECSTCGEKIYDRVAMQKIEKHSPAFAKRHSGKKTAA